MADKTRREEHAQPAPDGFRHEGHAGPEGAGDHQEVGSRSASTRRSSRSGRRRPPALRPPRRPALRQRQHPPGHGPEQDPQGLHRQVARPCWATTPPTSPAGTATACRSRSTSTSSSAGRKRTCPSWPSARSAASTPRSSSTSSGTSSSGWASSATGTTPYLTMNPAYEAEVLGTWPPSSTTASVYKGKRPVHWCIHCQTALAEAEIEYKDKTSPSIYVKLPRHLRPRGQDSRPWPAAASRHHLDDDPLDPAGQPGHRLPSRVRVRRGRGRRRGLHHRQAAPARRRRGARLARAQGPGDIPRARARGPQGPPPLHRPRIALRPGRLRHPRGRHGLRPHRARATATTTT